MNGAPPALLLLLLLLYEELGFCLYAQHSPAQQFAESRACLGRVLA
jgi:hypothetical protein